VAGRQEADLRFVETALCVRRATQAVIHSPWERIDRNQRESPFDTSVRLRRCSRVRLSGSALQLRRRSSFGPIDGKPSHRSLPLRTRAPRAASIRSAAFRLLSPRLPVVAPRPRRVRRSRTKPATCSSVCVALVQYCYYPLPLRCCCCAMKPRAGHGSPKEADDAYLFTQFSPVQNLAESNTYLETMTNLR